MLPPDAAAAAANNKVGDNGTRDVCSTGVDAVVGQFVATP